MAITQALNTKGNIRKSTNNDIPFSPAQPVISSYYATSTASQTVINLTFSILTTGVLSGTDAFWLFVDGKKLDLGSTNDYTFTNVQSDGTSSQVTLNQSLSSGLNIQAFKLGLKPEVQFGMDNRFINLYANQNAGFQGFVSQTDNIMTPTSSTGSPAAGTFYTSIQNRASMVDLSQDLKPRMGIERIMIGQIFPIQGEAGPNGEQIWGIPNDPYNQVRFAGYWTINAPVNGRGVVVGPSANNTFIEVTFYGTGLNLLGALSGSIDTATILVDGVSQGSFSLPNISSASSFIFGRNYSPNQPFNVVAGLTLGVHTVKVLFTSSNNYYSGFEILNESSSVKVNPGIGYTQGQKLSLTAQNVFSYSAPVTGSRGGRVLVYQKSDGTIGQSFQAVNASQANLTGADHTNEEVARTYYYREFGAARSDDFSSNSPSSAAFTLDDDSTALYGSTLTLGNSFNGTDGIQVANGSILVLGFVGTGLDVEIQTNASTTGTYTVSVDGTSVGTLTLNTSPVGPAVYKLVSGLPYGTHVCKIAFTSPTNVTILRYFAYQPKKPSLPSGAVELCDYNVMATFVANSTVNVENVSTGVLRKHCIREATYVEGTGGSANWTFTNPIGTPSIYGNSAFTDRANAFVEYTFFGTGVDIRGEGSSVNGSTTIQVSLQNITGGGSLQNATTTNFPSLTSSAYGTTFTASTGILQQNISNAGNGLVLSGLALGLWKVRLNNNTASTDIRFSSFDVICPIHSYKSNLYSDFQNALPVGSNSISDNRKTTPVKDLLPATKAWNQSYGIASGPTTNSTSLVPIPDMSAAVKTSAGAILISFAGDFFNGTSGRSLFLQIYVDGIAQGTQFQTDAPGSNVAIQASMTQIVPVGAGTHQVMVYWAADSASFTWTARSSNRALSVREL